MSDFYTNAIDDVIGQVEEALDDDEGIKNRLEEIYELVGYDTTLEITDSRTYFKKLSYLRSYLEYKIGRDLDDSAFEKLLDESDDVIPEGNINWKINTFRVIDYDIREAEKHNREVKYRALSKLTTEEINILATYGVR